MTTIKLKNGSGAPTAGDLVQGEPALDLTNKRLYTENASGTVIEVGTNPTSLTTGTFTSTGIDDNATSTAITIDSNENVGIGTSSPNIAGFSRCLTIDGADSGVELSSGGTVYATLAANAQGANLQGVGTSGIRMFTAASGSATEHARIDIPGNLLVGTTQSSVYNSSSNSGHVLEANGTVQHSRSGFAPMLLNRISSDGNITEFFKDGSLVGSIGTAGGGLTIGNGDTGVFFDAGNDNIRPFSLTTNGSLDAAIDLGRSTTRFKDLYLSGGVYLGGTGSANHLDDYEEGTWTPSFSGAGSPSYTTQFGRYTKIGRVVYCSIAIRATSVSGTSNIEIAGLPFAPSESSDAAQRSTYSPFLGGHCSGLSESTGRFRVLTNTNMAGVKGSTSTTFMTAAEFSSGGSPQITGDFWYYTS